MRWNYVAATLGIALAVGGMAVLGYGVLRAAGDAASTGCVDSGCDGPWLLAFPAGIIAMVFGLIVGSWGISSIRAERGNTGPLGAFSVMTGLGLVFLSLGVLFLFASSKGGGGDAEGTFLFLGGLFFLMGIGFVGTDLWRFRGALKKDRLRVSGLHGTATVVGVSDSNVTINNNPMVNLELDVSIPGQAPFRVKRRALISRLSVGSLSPGSVLSVLADPSKPRDVMIDWEAAASAPVGAGASFLSASDVGEATGTVVDATRGIFEPAMLRLISQALAGAADRAGQTGKVTHMPDGTTVIDGGTTVMIDGHPVELGTAMGSSIGLQIQNALAARAAQGSAPGTAAFHPGGTMFPVPSATPGGPTIGATDAADVQGLAPGAGALPARVNLDSIQDSGVDIAGDRLYTFDLTVSVAGRPSYQTKFAAVVPKTLVPRLAKGASFPAHVDPDEPAHLSVQWDH